MKKAVQIYDNNSLNSS